MSRDKVKIQAELHDNDGTVWRECPSCGEPKPLDQFGLRRMGRKNEDGTDEIRNQSWCRACRSKPRRRN